MSTKGKFFQMTVVAVGLLGGLANNASAQGPDAALYSSIVASCGGNPACVAQRWAAVEFDRCQRGIGVPGGCFGPNGEIMKHGGNAVQDLTEGPGDSNDLVGEDGFLRRTFGF